MTTDWWSERQNLVTIIYYSASEEVPLHSWFTDVSRKVTFPERRFPERRFPDSHFHGRRFLDSHFPGKTFPGKSFFRKNSVSLFYCKTNFDRVLCELADYTANRSLVVNSWGHAAWPGSSHLYSVSAQRPSTCSLCRAYLLTASNVK